MRNVSKAQIDQTLLLMDAQILREAASVWRLERQIRFWRALALAATVILAAVVASLR
jgi:anti-sigma-K factor RskA